MVKIVVAVALVASLVLNGYFWFAVGMINNNLGRSGHGSRSIVAGGARCQCSIVSPAD